MKENKYDDEVFFEKYSQMDRSQKGLKGAGEWRYLKSLLPSLKNIDMLDLGCGYGWHMAHVMEEGGKSAVGVDISRKMIEVAREKNQYENVEHICMPIEDIDLKEDSFDLILSSLTFHYIEDFNQIVKKANRYLRAKGSFVFSVEHPIFTSHGTQDWHYDENGNILHFPVDNYYYEGKREAVFLREKVAKYHRTLTTYINELLGNGFVIDKIIEPEPSEEMVETRPEMKNEMRRPMMLIIAAHKL